MKHRYRACLCAAGLLVGWTETSGALEIRTGKWQVETEIQNSVSPQPQYQSSVECITESSFDPAQAMLQDGQCTVTDRNESANSISWRFECGGGGDVPVSSGTGRFVSNGEAASGDMQMSMEFNGQTMTMTNNWKGQLISDTCD